MASDPRQHQDLTRLDTPASEAEAKLHINRIRSEYIVNGQDRLARAAHRNLEILAKELYDSSTHFVLELLQNADDNKYHNTEPTLRLSYKPGSLRVDCNEVGFSRANVHAICSIRESTKNNRDASKGFTGEKGIGFKSVFRMADVVWIASHHYQFKLDNRETLGMIAPKWDPFPEPLRPGWTSFYFQLRQNDGDDIVLRALHELGPECMLFLRRIRRVQIEARRGDGTAWDRKILKSESKQSGISFVTLDLNGTESRYLLSHHTVDAMPKEDRRSGQSTAVLSLAFQLHQTGTVRPASQKVYAGLPVDDHGLKFLINGDFLLTANRQQIDITSQWNAALRNGVAQAFIAAVDIFNDGDFKYTWPAFASADGVSQFFKPAIPLIVQALYTRPILESMSGLMLEPKRLVYAEPTKFADRSGVPFTCSSKTAYRYLSSKYPAWTITSTLALGVREMSDAEFLKELGLVIGDDPLAFQKQPTEWHSRLANSLLRFADIPELLRMLQLIEMIPLAYGRWTSASAEPIFPPSDLELLGLSSPMEMGLNSSSTNADSTSGEGWKTASYTKTKRPKSAKIALPTRQAKPSAPRSGMESILIVHSDVASDQRRKALFERIGVKSMDTHAVCKLIGELHCAEAFVPSQWPCDELVCHAEYLYNSSWSPAEGNDLWFATTDNRHCKGSQLYELSHSKSDSALGRISSRLSVHFRRLHPGYLARRPHDKKWLNYLTTSLRISRIPRLVTAVDGEPGSSPRFRLSDVFKAMFDHCEISDVVEILNDNWGNYAPHLEHTKVQIDARSDTKISEEYLSQFDEDQSPFTKNTHRGTPSTGRQSTSGGVLEEMKHLAVKTRTGRSELQNTALAMIDPLLDRDNLWPTLDLNIPVDFTLKHRLHCLGVTVESNLDYYIACLRALSTQVDPVFETIAYIYERLQTYFDADERSVELALSRTALVYVSSQPEVKSGPTTHRRWLTLTECVKLHVDVAAQYRSSERLWRSLVATGGVSLASILVQTLSISLESSLTDILTILTKLSETLSRSNAKKSSNAIKTLSNKAILPVKTSPESLEYDSLRAPTDSDWFIGDKPYLADSFKGKVPLLAFSQQQDLEMLRQLLKTFRVGEKELSTRVHTKTITRGLQRIRNKEVFFSLRARFVQALIPKKEQERKAIGRQLRDVRFYIAAEIAESYAVESTHTSIVGRPGIGSSFLDVNDDELSLYVTRDQSNPFEVVGRLATYCEIVEAAHLNLLYTLFGVEKVDDVEAIFAREGVMVSRSVNAEDFRPVKPMNEPAANKKSTRLARGSALSGDVDIIPSPFQGELDAGLKFPSPFQSSKHRNRMKHRDEAVDASLRGNGRFEDRRASGPATGKKERRLPHRGMIDEDGEKNKTIDQRLRLQFIGERMLSKIFHRNLGQLYQPDRHWTSSLRTRAGHANYDVNHAEQVSPFTLGGSEISSLVTDFLANSSALDTAQWRTSNPTYHFELALSPGHSGEPFEWTTDQLSRIRQRRLQTDPTQTVSNVVVLVRISNIYSHPQVKFFINPFDLLTSGALNLQTGSVLQATIPTNDELDRLALSFANDRQRLSSISQMAPESVYNNAFFDASSSLNGHQTSPWMPSNGIPFSSDAMQARIETIKAQAAGRSLRSSGTFSVPRWPNDDIQDPLAPPYLRHDRGGRLRDQRHAFYNGKGQATSSRQPTRNEDATLYQYSPLGPEEIRLLILYPGNYKDMLHGIICTVRFEATGRYRALSYTWGDDSQPRYTLLTPDGSLSIRQSLRDALRALRHRKDTVVLWIDALCINQQDSREKAQQIPVIARVFQGAACTLAYVSNDSQDEEALIAMELIAIHSSSNENQSDAPDETPPCPMEWTSRGLPPKDNQIWDKILQLFARPWFRRSWVVQEAVVATTLTVICRNKSLDWNKLLMAAEAIVQEFEINGDSCTVLIPFLELAKMREWDAQQKRFPLRKLLETFRHTSSTVARDRFYSLLGIASDGHTDLFEPTYRRRFEDVVFCFGLAFLKIEIEEGNPMNILCRAGLGSQANRFQSWIPDWTTTRSRSLSHCDHQGTMFSASGNLDPDITHVINTDELSVLAYLVDEVHGTSLACNEVSQHKSYFDDVDRMTTALGNKYWEQELDDIKWQVPIAGAIDPQKLVHKKTSVRDSYLAFREYAIKVQPESHDKGISGLSSAEAAALWDRGQNYRSLLGEELAGWRFITSKTRQLCGIACGSVAKHDVIAILCGGKVPFILRKSETRSGAYRLVGEAYVDGIMLGEALEFDKVARETIRLH